jgi:hypothetical protein
MSRTFGANQFAGGTHASLKQMTTVRDTVGAPHHHVRVDLRLSVLEGDVANERKQVQLLNENAGWIALFRFPVEPTQLRVRKRADGFKLLPSKPCPFANCCNSPATSSPVSKIRTKVFGSSSICFHRMFSLSS